jgi:hypothetical protein
MTGIRRSRVPFCGVWERDTWEISTDRNLIRKAREQKREVQFKFSDGELSNETFHGTTGFFYFSSPLHSSPSLAPFTHDVCVCLGGGGD